MAMTETPLPPTPEGDTMQDPRPPDGARRLVRHPDDKVVGGVCAAFGRYTGTDPVLWRVTIAALALFGGAGIALYVLGWLLVPRIDQPASFVERRLRRPDRTVSVGGVILLFVIALVVLGLLDNSAGLAVLAVIAGLAYLVSRERAGGGVPPVAGEGPWAPTGVTSSYGVPPFAPSPTAYVPAAPRPRSPLGAITVSAAVLVAGLLALLNALDVDGITTPRVLAAALLVVGAGLIIGAFWGRARWLIAVGIVLAVVLAPIAALDGRVGNGVGERTWVPTAGSVPAQGYRLTAGEVVLDLRRLDPGDLSSLKVELGLGELLVLVPSDLRVEVDTDLGIGELQESTGTADRAIGGVTRVDEDELLSVGPATGRVLDLQLEVGVGEIEVRRVQG